MSEDKKDKYEELKKERREKKRITKRDISVDEVIFIFEKVLEEWKTIKIYNTLIQQNPKSNATKKKIEVISTGNCKLYPSEFSCNERYHYWVSLRENVYKKHLNNKINK
jgi:hypothetical protein